MRTEFERRADQLTRQLEDSRDRVDDLVKEYRGLLETGEGQVRATAKEVRATATETRANVADALSGLTQNPPPWWIPVAIVAAIVVLAMLAKNYVSPPSNVT
jgi:hypothetical protein